MVRISAEIDLSDLDDEHIVSELAERLGLKEGEVQWIPRMMIQKRRNEETEVMEQFQKWKREMQLKFGTTD